MARVIERASWPEIVRIQAVESDLDENDNQIAKLKGAVDKMVWAMVGLLISVSTAAILLGLNLAVGK